jgi:uncharacterized Zn-finger protein
LKSISRERLARQNTVGFYAGSEAIRNDTALGTRRTPRYGAAKFATIPATEGFPMAEHVVPHFHNDPGVPVIEIGAKEFMCVGATPPHDHPHVFLDMGEDNEIICPYCSTLYRFDPKLDPHAARPGECALPSTAAA